MNIYFILIEPFYLILGFQMSHTCYKSDSSFYFAEIFQIFEVLIMKIDEFILQN